MIINANRPASEPSAKVSGPVNVVGVCAVLSGEPCEIAAETVGPCVINVVEKDGLLRLMERGGELGLRSALAVTRVFRVNLQSRS